MIWRMTAMRPGTMAYLDSMAVLNQTRARRSSGGAGESPSTLRATSSCRIRPKPPTTDSA